MQQDKPRVFVVCSDECHPVMAPLREWAQQISDQAEVRIIRQIAHTDFGDYLFLVACQSRIERSTLSRFRNAFVLHASDLPKGRGWSPMIWQLLGGATEVTVSLINVAEKIDEGNIRAQRRFAAPAHETLNEINKRLFQCEIELMNEAIADPGALANEVQDSAGATYYPKRTPADSELDPELSITEQFERLRLADHERYPCYFYLRGHKYLLKLEKASEQASENPK